MEREEEIIESMLVDVDMEDLVIEAAEGMVVVPLEDVEAVLIDVCVEEEKEMQQEEKQQKILQLLRQQLQQWKRRRLLQSQLHLLL